MKPEFYKDISINGSPIDVPVGGRFVYGSSCFEVVEDSAAPLVSGCNDCDFHFCSKRHCCLASECADGKDVHFVAV